MLEESRRIEQVRGTRDVLPEEFAKRTRAWEIIRGVFESFAYRGVEVPTIEPIELHLRKSGEAIRRNMYTFKDHKTNVVCLRPELTASVVRMYNSSPELSKAPHPLKLYYLGSSFRYDRPQLGRYREFTQAGVELIGGATPAYDAEIIALACQVMYGLGIQYYEVVIGNIGIILQLLNQKQLEERVKNFIIESMETITKAGGKEGIDQIKVGLKEIGIDFDEQTKENKELLNAVRELPSAHVQKVISYVIQTIYGNTGERRNPGEIAQNLLSRLTRDEQRKEILETISFIDELTQIKGVPPKVFDEIDDLIQKYNLHAGPLNELREIANVLGHYAVDWSKIKINLGFGRGLQYYTGMIFEVYIYSEKLGESQKQVCGGGRYDSLIKDLGNNQNVPALGFSFGLERLILAMPESKSTADFLDVFIAPLEGEVEFLKGVDIIQVLRKMGFRVDIGPKGKLPRELLGLANRLNAKFTIIVGGDEISGNFVTLRNMIKNEQIKCSLEEAILIIEKGVK